MGNMVIRMLMTQLAQRYSSKKNERFLIVFGTFYLFAGITKVKKIINQNQSDLKIKSEKKDFLQISSIC
ncbi:hypothetical protein DERF_009067 [Dermatophagoides farinae]|uniref:Uncharacterized protein n=1 Tax=Dermatophagoides farinae TaxID=6954 RepID=A0A922HT88_DERFA|nr:hypothetical protein DERF_009067 [Dermatophagoides farinae]